MSVIILVVVDKFSYNIMLDNIGHGIKFIQTEDKTLNDIVQKTKEKSGNEKFVNLLEENLSEERRLLELMRKSLTVIFT